jgi:hypothetical protein
MQSEVDVNVLISLYNQKLSLITNQNVLLEAKLQSLLNDFNEEKQKLLMANLELQKKVDDLEKRSQNKKPQKFSDAEVE